MPINHGSQHVLVKQMRHDGSMQVSNGKVLVLHSRFFFPMVITYINFCVDKLSIRAPIIDDLKSFITTIAWPSLDYEDENTR